jgi:hypothetical protein
VSAATGTGVDGGAASTGVDGGTVSTGVEWTAIVGVGLGKVMPAVNPICRVQAGQGRVRPKCGSRAPNVNNEMFSLLNRWK